MGGGTTGPSAPEPSERYCNSRHKRIGEEWIKLVIFRCHSASRHMPRNCGPAKLLVAIATHRPVPAAVRTPNSHRKMRDRKMRDRQEDAGQGKMRDRRSNPHLSAAEWQFDGGYFVLFREICRQTGTLPK